ncbi:MAG: TetR family transcriptional regulator C-terminal domain-containing protein [Bacteroidota bacterium]
MNIKHKKTDIVSGGEAVFRANGYHNTGVKEILDACGISKGSFYNFFPTKEAYALEVIEYYGNRLTAFMDATFSDQSQNTIERLRSFYYSLVSIAEAEACTKGCLVYNMAFELAGNSDTVARALDIQFEAWVTRVTACIAEGQAAGDITTSQSAEDLAAMLHTAVNGSYGRVKMKRDTAPMRQMIDTLLAFIAS